MSIPKEKRKGENSNGPTFIIHSENSKSTKLTLLSDSGERLDKLKSICRMRLGSLPHPLTKWMISAHRYWMHTLLI